MKTLLTFTILALSALIIHGADESDAVMPEAIDKAEIKVNVLMRYINSTGECFPDRDAKIRFENGRVILGDFKLYKNREPRLSEGLVAFQLDKKWGACDKDGKVILPAQFNSEFEFHEGLAGVNEAGKQGFINKEGKWVIRPRFDTDYTWDFIGEVCAVYIGGKGAVINKKGDFIWEPSLLRAENLAGGIFIQTADGREGFLDNIGKLIPIGETNPRYPIRATTLRLEADLEAKYPLSITEIGLVNANFLALKIANKSKGTITIPLESGFPDYSSNSNCLLLRIRKSNSAKEDFCGVKPMQTTLVIPSLSSAVVIVQATKQSFGLHKNDEIEVAIDNTRVAVGLEGIKQNAIHHGLILSEKIKLLDGFY